MSAQDSQATDNPLRDIKIGQITSQWAQRNHIYSTYKSEIDSTNNLAKSEAFAEALLAEPLAVYVTDHQTAGRGRSQNSWLNDTPGSALLSSWSYMLNTKPQPTASCHIGLALYRACSATWPFLDWNLKAPNDIYIRGKKIAGILLESVMQGDELRLIIGIGINITAAPQSVNNATSLIAELPPGVPLLGQDYLAFLDRLLFEITEAITYVDSQLSPTERLALLKILNQHPLLKEKYTDLEPNGSLIMGEKKISWMNL
jgi:BirA family biotin operon repressor/biotin-[acetyl-CoA-carboxylase] ligase